MEINGDDSCITLLRTQEQHLSVSIHKSKTVIKCFSYIGNRQLLIQCYGQSRLEIFISVRTMSSMVWLCPAPNHLNKMWHLMSSTLWRCQCCSSALDSNFGICHFRASGQTSRYRNMWKRGLKRSGSKRSFFEWDTE